MSGNLELRIRERAHAIWEREGRPEGREVAHWQMAAAEIAAEAAPARKPRPAKAAAAAETKEPALKRAAAARASAPSRSRKTD
jgi:Protein of unknown function (DUF2934)